MASKKNRMLVLEVLAAAGTAMTPEAIRTSLEPRMRRDSLTSAVCTLADDGLVVGQWRSPPPMGNRCIPPSWSERIYTITPAGRESLQRELEGE